MVFLLRLLSTFPSIILPSQQKQYQKFYTSWLNLHLRTTSIIVHLSFKLLCFFDYLLPYLLPLYMTHPVDRGFSVYRSGIQGRFLKYILTYKSVQFLFSFIREM